MHTKTYNIELNKSSTLNVSKKTYLFIIIYKVAMGEMDNLLRINVCIS